MEDRLIPQLKEYFTNVKGPKSLIIREILLHLKDFLVLLTSYLSDETAPLVFFPFFLVDKTESNESVYQ